MPYINIKPRSKTEIYLLRFYQQEFVEILIKNLSRFSK